MRRAPSRTSRCIHTARSYLTGGRVTRLPVASAEARDLYAALKRNDGLFYLYRAAGFVDEHRAQGTRLDFGRIFTAYSDRVPFAVGGSDEDPFEHRQVTLAEQRLGKRGLTIVRLPGGHLTTNERPQALAHLIRDFADSA